MQEAEKEEILSHLNALNSSIVLSFYPRSLKLSSVCWCFQYGGLWVRRGGTNGKVDEMHAERNGSYGGGKTVDLYAMVLDMLLLRYARVCTLN